MAARKKTKKKSAGRRSSKKVALNVVVGSKVKEAVKSHGVRCSGDLVGALNEKVLGLLGAAVARCEANKRGTVRPQDL
jgi:histone H3/H4